MYDPDEDNLSDPFMSASDIFPLYESAQAATRIGTENITDD